MIRLYLLTLVTVLGCNAQLTRKNLAPLLDFESGQPGLPVLGWQTAPAVIDDKVFRSGKQSARIERTLESPATFTSLTANIPRDFEGQTLVLKGYLRLGEVDGVVALWIRVDGENREVLGFDSTQWLQLKGSSGWTFHMVSVPVAAGTKSIYFGALIQGTGKLWVDDLQLEVDGKSIELAPDYKAGSLDLDTEFNAGSGIKLNDVTQVQIQNLALLGKVWGFLKYHHPLVTAGKKQWDYELFRVMPQVLAAKDTKSAQDAMLSWIKGIGEVPQCNPCATLNESRLYRKPKLEWLSELGPLGETLKSIHHNRSASPPQFYVSLFPGVGNPRFLNELPYSKLSFPDSGFQLLGLYRYWSLFEYFSPNIDIAGDSPAYWTKVLEEHIPRVALAKTKTAYELEMFRFIAKINDSHSSLWSSIAVRPPTGDCRLAANTRFVEGRPVVVRTLDSGLVAGDVIERIGGAAISNLLEEWKPFYPASNESARLRDIGTSLTNGACGPVELEVRRGGESIKVTATRQSSKSLDLWTLLAHDRPGEPFQKLSPEIAYLKISKSEATKSADYIRQAEGTKGLIIDIRGYPSTFQVFTLGALLAGKPGPFVVFTGGDLINPGAFHWIDEISLSPKEPHYKGKVIILVDESTQSSAEYHTMAFRTAPGAIVMGSQTAGADGNISPFPLPGGLNSRISGIGVFYPDKRPTQRIGIVPDIEVKPTIEGIRAGRDEVLEAAIRQII